MSGRDIYGEPLEELEFLARSPNRIRVLETLTDGPIDRYKLEEDADVSRATLGRILDDFLERHWIVEDERAYETTQLGAYVAREVAAVLKGFEPIPVLNKVAQWFPEEGFEFDIGLLAGATVIRSTKSDALAPTTHIANRIRTADRVRLITYSVLPGVMEACWRGTVDGNMQLETVLDTGAMESVGTKPELVDQVVEMFATGQAEVYWHEEAISSTVFIIDDDVLLCLSGGEGAPLAVIETDNESVRSWAESTIDTYCQEGERLDPSLFTG
jgi:predicted transcriptional regulator